MAQRLNRKFGPWLGHHAWEFKWYYLGAFLCLFCLQTLQSEIPARIRLLTQSLGTAGMGGVSVWIFLGLAIGILIFRTFSRLLFFFPARVQQKLLRMELLDSLEAVPPTRYGSRSQGQLFQILFDDINNLRAFVGFGLLQVGNLVIAAWVLIPRLNEADGHLWPAFTPLFASVLLFTVVTLINQRIFKRMMEKKGEVQQYIIESYEAKQTIKNFHREDNFVRNFVKVSSEELSLFFKSSIGFAISGPYVKLGLGASLLWGAVLIRRHGGDTSDLVFFSGFLYLFLEPVMFLSWVAVVMSQGFAAWGRVKELHRTLQEPSALEKELAAVHVELGPRRATVTLDYWERPIDLSFRSGGWTALIGETGSGKSRILTNLSTAMVLQGMKVSMVQQEPYLFNDTVGGNIFLGREREPALLGQARELLAMFQLDVLEPDLNVLLEMEVGENGKRLSGGQMKRVALVRSLLSGAEVLVWDDPFSSVDIILERKIIRSLKASAEWSSRTFIISSHRLTTVRLSDEAVFLEKGKGISAQGETHEVLKDPHVNGFFQEQVVELPLA